MDFFLIEEVLALNATSEPKFGFVVASVSALTLTDEAALFQQCSTCRKKVDGDQCLCGKRHRMGMFMSSMYGL